jgi:hypothetical protein
VLADGTDAVVLDEPARDYLPTTRPGGRLPHAWLPDGRSTLDLIDPRVPTILTMAGVAAPAAGGRLPLAVASCPADVWGSTLDLDTNQCLIVRPDQHIAYRGPVNGVTAALGQLFAP